MENIKAKKSLGQNFLINDHVVKKILNVIDYSKYENILEIGPGYGALTKSIVKKCKKLIAYEIDLDLIEYLTKLKIKNLEIINDNFLNADLTKYKDLVVFGNIPYNITTDIIFKLIRNSKNIRYAILMMQKEVADRILSPIKCKTYGKLTLSVSYVANSKKIIDVHPNDFNPKPKVNSTVIILDFNKNYEYDLFSFLSFIKVIFQFKRKTLWNNLSTKYNKNILTNVFKILNLNMQIRSEELTLEMIKQIYAKLN